jgi:hypothetical protein
MEFTLFYGFQTGVGYILANFIPTAGSTNEALRHEGVWGSGCMDPRSLDFCNWSEVTGQLHAPAALPPIPIS